MPRSASKVISRTPTLVFTASTPPACAVTVVSSVYRYGRATDQSSASTSASGSAGETVDEPLPRAVAAATTAAPSAAMRRHETEKAAAATTSTDGRSDALAKRPSAGVPRAP